MYNAFSGNGKYTYTNNLFTINEKVNSVKIRSIQEKNAKKYFCPFIGLNKNYLTKRL